MNLTSGFDILILVLLLTYMGSGVSVGTHRIPEKSGIGLQQEKYFWVPASDP